MRVASARDDGGLGLEEELVNILKDGPLVAGDWVDAFLKARFSQEPRQLRRFGKVANAEAGTCC
jgi:hypothetical protein